MKMSNHTLLINMVIGLCRKVHGWPSTLKDLGYDVDWIEPRLINSEGKKVVPDLMLTSNRYLHTLIVECKGGKSANEDQQERLHKLTVDSIKPRASVYDSKKLQFDVCFALFEENIRYINLKYDFPILSFSDTELRKYQQFKSAHLEKAFSNAIPINCEPPTEFIPFMADDDKSLIAIYVLRELLLMALESKKRRKKDELKFIEDDILRRIYGNLWNNIDESSKKELREKVRSILNMVKTKDLKNKFLDKIKEKGKHRWIIRSLQAFAKECEKIVQYYERQYEKQIKHKDLSEFI